MKKSLVSLYALLLLFITTIVSADHGHDASSTQLKLALDFSGNKLRVSSIKIKKSRERLVALRVVLNEKRKRKEISDDDYEAKIEIIKEYEEECVSIEADMVELDAVIKIKHQEFPKASIEVKIGDKERDEHEHHKQKHKHHDCEYDEHECKHHHHHDNRDHHHHGHDDHDDDDDEQ